MQIAKFFAALGFQVDTTDLDKFENKLRDVRASSALFARNLKSLSNRLTEVKLRVKELNDKLDLTSQKKGTNGVATAYEKMGDSIYQATRYVQDFANKSDYAKPKIDSLTDKVLRGKSAWEGYAKAVKESRDAIMIINTQLNQMRASPPKVTVTSKQYVQSTGGGSAVMHQPRFTPTPVNDPSMMPMIIGDIRQFFRSMTPTGVMASGALGAGYLTKEIVQAGREGQKMERILLGASANAETFGHNLEYVKKTSHELALSTNEFGMAYAKILQATEKSPLSLKQTEEMMTAMSEMMSMTGMSTPDQVGVFRQIGQMFTLGRIQQDELNSLADRGFNLAKYLRMAAKDLGIKDYQKLQEAGKADPVKLIPAAIKYLREDARRNDALAKSLQTSAAAQRLFKNKLEEYAKVLLESGVDKFLAKIFTLATDLLVIMKEIGSAIAVAAKGISLFSKAIAGFVAENKTAGIILAGVLATILAMTVAKRQGISATGVWANALISAFNNIGKALRFAGILGALWGIYEFGKAYSDHLAGDTNWVSLYISKIELLISWFDLLISKWNLFVREKAPQLNFQNPATLGVTSAATVYTKMTQNKSDVNLKESVQTPSSIEKALGFYAEPIKIDLSFSDIENGKQVEIPLRLGSVGQ